MVEFDLFGPFSAQAALNLEFPEELADVRDAADDQPHACNYRKHARRYSRDLLLQHQWELVGYDGSLPLSMTGDEFLIEQLYLTCHTQAEFDRGWLPNLVRARELGFVVKT